MSKRKTQHDMKHNQFETVRSANSLGFILLHLQKEDMKSCTLLHQSFVHSFLSVTDQSQLWSEPHEAVCSHMTQSRADAEFAADDEAFRRSARPPHTVSKYGRMFHVWPLLHASVARKLKHVVSVVARQSHIRFSV